MYKILFVTSELFPLVKTGGLADVSRSLPEALIKQNQDVIIAVPGYSGVLDGVEQIVEKRQVSGIGIHPETQLWVASLPYSNFAGSDLPNSNLTVWIVVNAALYERDGGPYEDENKIEWPDNAYRFSNFCRAVAELVQMPDAHWRPDVVHCNDWQSGLVAPLLSLNSVSLGSTSLPAPKPATVFTIHNLAYQGNFGSDVFNELLLPKDWWSYEKLEFHGMFSFLKGGIVFSDFVTTVSPTYAQEILSVDYGCGMEGLLSHCSHKLKGILNGVDYSVWSPSKDPYLTVHFDENSLDGKALNKAELQKEVGFKPMKSHMVAGVVSRLAHQKGIDLLIPVIRELIDEKINWIILGSGNEALEKELLKLASEYPEKIAMTVGYDETFAHQIEAGSDLFVMPSRYEPCGLNQIYSLKYGTLPLVRKTGGLADTVVNANGTTIAEGTTTGFMFDAISSNELMEAVVEALKLFRRKSKWKAAQKQAMQQDFSWEKSATEYIKIYQSVLNAK